ncbi:MAG TPA: PhzF family phenazine biosynthesis protein [Actinomycetes bacterium]
MRSYVIADVFTDTPLEGNPVAVFTDAGDLSSELMQRIAREMNLSETVFVLPGDGDADARIRIFTPSTELPFAGHPTLGTALILGEPTSKDMITLATGAGLVPVRFERADGRITAGRMRQPIPTWEPYEHADRLLEALGVSASQLPVEAYRNGPRHVFVVLTSEQAVTALEPDMTALGKLPDIGVSCIAGSGTRWKSRMFAPAYGVAEDPATGSAAGPLALHLARHGRIAFGQEIEIHQGAEVGRPSTLYARVEGTGDQVETVEVAGSAVVVANGELRV